MEGGICMKKYQVKKLENGKVSYIADIIEADGEQEAVKKYIDKIKSYWGFCVYSENDFIATMI